MQFILELDDNLPELFLSDAQRLKQIMINILRNSVKFTLSGFIKLTVKRSSNNYLKLSFYDTGIGIEEKNLKCLGSLFGKIIDS